VLTLGGVVEVDLPELEAQVLVEVVADADIDLAVGVGDTGAARPLPTFGNDIDGAHAGIYH
jgi:hypothetical protein